MPDQVGVVVVTYFPGPTLGELLDSLPAAVSGPCVVVVADNGSTDGSLELAEQRPDVEILRTGANLGYGAAANAGVRQLPPEVTDVLIVNSDVVFGPASIDLLRAALHRSPTVGAVGPKIVDDRGIVYPSARQLPSIGAGIGHALLGWCWPSNPWTRAYRQDHAAPVERPAGWLSGACLLLRRSAFEQIDGFDPRYFMYFEDVDLGARLQQAGWSNLYLPSATVMHIGGHSTENHAPLMIRAHHESAYRYLAGRHPRWWEAPLRGALWLGLRARTAIALRSSRVAGGAEIPHRVDSPGR